MPPYPAASCGCAFAALCLYYIINNAKCSIHILHPALDVALGIALRKIMAFVIKLFTLGNGKFQFHKAVPQIKPERNQAIPLRLCKGLEFADLLFMQQ